MAEIQSINHRHEQIVNWLVSNPHRSLGECAREFNYTQAWLSQVIHSDMFQALYRQRCQEEGALVIHTMKDKLQGLAARSIERSVELLETGAGSERFVQETTKNVLNALGYAPQIKTPERNTPVQINIGVSAEDLIAARERAQAKRFGNPGQDNVLDVRAVPSKSPALLQEAVGFSD